MNEQGPRHCDTCGEMRDFDCNECTTCRDREECSECEQLFDELAPIVDPWGREHGSSGMCQKCLDDYDPTPYAYDSEPAVSGEERFQAAAKQKRELNNGQT